MKYYILDELEDTLHEVSESAHDIINDIILDYDIQHYHLLKIDEKSELTLDK